MERSIVALEDHDHGSSSTALSKSVGSIVKIDSISIDLGIAMEKNEAGKCHHFSIRGYVSDMRRKDPRVCFPFTSGGQTSKLEEQLPPLHVAKFRWWRCQNCLEEIGAPTHKPHHCDKAMELFSDIQQEASELPNSEANEAEENINPAGKNNLSLSNDKKEKNTEVGQTSVNGYGNVEERKIDENIPAITLCEDENHFSPSNDKKDKNTENTATEHTTVNGHKNGSQDGSIQESFNTACDQARYNSSLNQTRCTDDRGNTEVSGFQAVAVASKNSGLVYTCLPTHGSHGAADIFPATKYPVCRGNSSAETSPEENFASADEEQRNVLGACEEPKEAGIIDEAINAAKDQFVEHLSLEMESRDNPTSERGEILAADSHQDQQNDDDSSGFPRRRTRKVRLLTDLLCGRQITESNHHCKKEGSPFNSITNESSALASVSASPSKVALHENVSTVVRVPQMKRKMPQNQGKKLIDMDCPSNGVKKAMFFKGDADASIMGNKNSGSGSEEASTAAGLLNSDKHKWTKYETQRNSTLGKNKKKMTLVGDEFFPMVPWPQIITKMNQVNMGDADKRDASAETTLKSNHDLFTGRGIDPYFRSCAPSLQTERKFSMSKKRNNKPQLEDGQALVRPQINQMFGEGSLKRKDVENMSGSGLGNLQSETELRLSLSLSTNAQRNEKDYSALLEDKNDPLLPKRIPSRDLSRKDDYFVRQPSIPHEAMPYPASKEGLFYDLHERINRRASILHDQLNFFPELSNGSFVLNQKLDFSDPLQNKGNGVVPGSAKVVRVHNHQRPEKVVANGTSEDIPMDIVELMAKNQYERGLCEAGTSYSLPGTSNKRNPELIGYPKVNGNEMILFEKEYPTMRKPPFPNATNGMIPTGENVAPIRSSASFFHHDRNRFNMGQQVECPPFAMLDTFSQNQQKLSSAVHFSDFGTLRNQKPQNSKCNGNKMIHKSSPTNMQVLEAFNTHHTDFRRNEAAGNVVSPMKHNHLPIGHNSPQKSTSQSSNIEMRDIDLNIGVPNDASLEEQNKILDLEPLNRVSGEYPHLTMEHNPKHMSSLDSSYSNDSIPAMQLLSLMDAGMISSTPFGLDGKKFLEKPFSPCNNHPSSGKDGNPNSMEKPHFPYSGLRPGVHKPIESLRHLSSERSPAIPVANGFSLFRNDGNVKGSTSYRGQIFARTQQQEKAKGGSYSPTQGRGRRSEESVYPIVGSSNTTKDKQKGIFFSEGDSVGYHLPWCRISDSNKRVGVGAQFMQGTVGPTSCQSGSDVCTINRNPADFSSPEAGNVYMISSEELKFGKKISYRGKSALENLDGRKRKRIIKSVQKERAQHHAS